ncbi:MAG: hypothetical protein J4F34_03770 [Gemmatimonadetes bacterium]|nr:hypothetical protein [Gemmatimonadota bacterium]
MDEPSTTSRSDLVARVGVHLPGSRGAAAVVVVVLVGVAWALFPARLLGQFRLGGQGLYRNHVVDDFGYGGRVEIDLGVLVSGLGIAGIFNTFPCGEEDCGPLTEVGGQVTFGGHSAYVGLNVVRVTRGAEGEAGDPDWRHSAVVGVRVGGLLPIAVPFLEIRQSLGSGLGDQTVAVGVLVGPAGSRRAPRRPPR